MFYVMKMEIWGLNIKLVRLHFNPHPHTEGDAELDADYEAPEHFNPHPHTEGDISEGGSVENTW